MTTEEIKKAVTTGKRVFCKNQCYEVILDSIGQYLIHCTLNNTYIGLTWRDGVTLNGNENDFFTL